MSVHASTANDLTGAALVFAPNAADSDYGWGWTGAATEGVALLVELEGETDLEGMGLHAVDTITGDPLWSQHFDAWITRLPSRTG